MLLRNQLTALFSPTRRLVEDHAPILHQGGPLGAMEWVVPRAQCHYRRIDLSALPARQRMAAARLTAQRYEPGPGAVHHLAWTGAIAHCWTWTQPLLRVVQQLDGWIPETLLRAPPVMDGPRLLGQYVGVEGQLWRDGQLQSSQWWPQPPALDAWRRFLRAGGLSSAAVEPLPDIQIMEWLPAPWGDLRRSLPGSPAARERMAWVGAACVVALGLGWQLLAQAHWVVAKARVDSEVATLRAQATPLLEARERADVALAALQDLRGLQQGVSDYLLMAQVLRPLPAEVRLSGWQRENNRLRVAVAGAQPDPRPYVSAYQSDPLLAGVTATPSNDGAAMELDFTLARDEAQADIDPAAAPETGASPAAAAGSGLQ
jgi:hypothetical protein